MPLTGTDAIMCTLADICDRTGKFSDLTTFEKRCVIQYLREAVEQDQTIWYFMQGALSVFLDRYQMQSLPLDEENKKEY